MAGKTPPVGCQSLVYSNLDADLKAQLCNDVKLSNEKFKEKYRLGNDNSNTEWDSFEAIEQLESNSLRKLKQKLGQKNKYAECNIKELKLVFVW